MKKKYFLNANIIDPQNSIDEVGGLIVDENGLIEAAGKKVNTNNIPSREKYIDLKGYCHNFKGANILQIVEFHDNKEYFS